MSNVSGVVGAMRKDGKGICIDDVWYSDYDGSNLRGVNKGSHVEFDFVKKGQWNNIKGKVKVISSGGGSYTPPKGKAWSNLGVELGHASNIAKDMCIASFEMEEIGSTDFYKAWIEHTEKVFKIMKSLRAKYEAGDEETPEEEEVIVKKPTKSVKPVAVEATTEELEDIF